MCELPRCLRNVVSMFHVIEKEMQWRRKSGRAEGFETLKTSKPIVAVGADRPLNDQIMMADYFRESFHKMEHSIKTTDYSII